MPRNKKAKNQVAHATRRARQRYGISLKQHDYTDLCRVLTKGNSQDCVFLQKQSNRVTFWAVFYEDKWLPVVYDKLRKRIATVLPPEALLPFKDKLPQEDKHEPVPSA